MKRIIWAIIAVIAIGIVIWLIYAVLWPIISGVLFTNSTSIVQKVGCVFTLFTSGKTFYATYKTGQKAWRSGEGWDKFFMMCIFSIMACMTIKTFANMGRANLEKMSSEAEGSDETSSEENSKENNDNEGENKEQKDSKSEKSNKEETSNETAAAQEDEYFDYQEGDGGTDPYFPDTTKAEDKLLGNEFGFRREYDGFLDHKFVRVHEKTFKNIVCRGADESLADYTRRFNIMKQVDEEYIRFDSDEATKIIDNLNENGLKKISDYILKNNDKMSNQIIFSKGTKNYPLTINGLKIN